MEDQNAIMEDAQTPEVSTTNHPGYSASRLRQEQRPFSLYSDASAVQQTQDDDLPDTLPETSESEILAVRDYKGSPTQVNAIPDYSESEPGCGIMQLLGNSSICTQSKAVECNDFLEEDYEGSPTQINALPGFLESQTDSKNIESQGHYSTIPTQIVPTRCEELAKSISDNFPAESQLVDGNIIKFAEHLSTTSGAPRPSIMSHFSSSKPNTPHPVVQLDQTAKGAASELRVWDSPIGIRNCTALEAVADTSPPRDQSNGPTQENICSTEVSSPGSNLPTNLSISITHPTVDIRKQTVQDVPLRSKPLEFPVIPDTKSVYHESSFNENTQTKQDFWTDSFSSSHPSLGSLPSLKELRTKAALSSSIALSSDESGPSPVKPDPAASFTSTGKPSSNKLSCRERKRIATSYNRPPALTRAMTQWVTKTNDLLDPFREDDDCWFHPKPPPARPAANGTLRPCGKLQKRFTWQDRRGKHSLVLNYGIVSKTIYYKLTKQQKDGFINNQWHLSHLCGNWTCLNPDHTTVEPGKVNISRNNCFSHRSGCTHEPQCLKDKKVLLSTGGTPVCLKASGNNSTGREGNGSLDEWSMQSFDDGEVSVMIDDNDDMEFALDGEDEDEDDDVIVLLDLEDDEQA